MIPNKDSDRFKTQDYTHIAELLDERDRKKKELIETFLANIWSVILVIILFIIGTWVIL